MSSYLWTEAPLVRSIEGEIVVLVTASPILTPNAARLLAEELLKAASEAELTVH